RNVWSATELRAARPVHGIELCPVFRRLRQPDGQRADERRPAVPRAAARLNGLAREHAMSVAVDRARPVDSGLDALVTLLHFQGTAADAGQIRHRLGTDKIGAAEILRCAKDLGIKARAHRSQWPRLARTPLPAIATLRDGAFMVLAKVAEDQVLVQS